MPDITAEALMAELKKVRYPGLSRDIVSFGIVKGVKYHEGIVSARFELETDRPELLDQMKAEAEKLLAALPGVSRVLIETKAVPPASRTGASAPIGGPSLLPGVRHTVAVASGKGGVGKSTVAVNLAVALAALGWKTGLLDADIYGPSVPMMMGLDGAPEQDENHKMIPFEQHGIKVMSIGFLVDKDVALIWRGPMIMKAITQMLGGVDWGTLDYLVVDLPPGTGDAQLTLSQAIKMSGAVIVTTPQDVALIDAVKGVAMFRKVEVPILGLVENMSYFVCGHCGGRTDIFNHGGARRESARLETPFLGEVPLDPSIRLGGDSGVPIVVSHPDAPQSIAFRTIAETVVRALGGGEPPDAEPAKETAFGRIKKTLGI